MYQVPVPPVPTWPYGGGQQIPLVHQLQQPEQTPQVQVSAMNHMQPAYIPTIPPQQYISATAAHPPPVQPPDVSSVQPNFPQHPVQPNAMPQPNYGQIWCQQNTPYNPWGQAVQQPNYNQVNYWNQNLNQAPPPQVVQIPSQLAQQQGFQHMQNLQPIDPIHPSQQVQQPQIPNVQPPQQPQQLQLLQQPHQVQLLPQPQQVQPSQQPQPVQTLEQVRLQQLTQFQSQNLQTPSFSLAPEPPLQPPQTPHQLPPPMQQQLHQRPPPVQISSEQQPKQWLPLLDTSASLPSNNAASGLLNQTNQLIPGHQTNQLKQDAPIPQVHPRTQQDPRQKRGDKQTTPGKDLQSQTSIAEKSQKSGLSISSGQSIPSSNKSHIYTSSQGIKGTGKDVSVSQPPAPSRASLLSDTLPTSVLGKPIDPLREPPPPPPPKKSLSSDLHTSSASTTGINVSLSNSPVNISNDNLGAFGSKLENQIVQESLASLRVQLDTLEKQIKTYQIEYQKWHQDFVKWQKQHQNHPDQKKYIDYQKQYQKMIEEQQSQLKQQYAELQKKINKRKEEQKAAAAVKTASMIISNAASKAAAAKAKVDSSDIKNLLSNSQQCKVQQSHGEVNTNDNSPASQIVVSCNVANVPPPPTSTSDHQINTSHIHDPPPPPPPPGSPGKSLHPVSTSNISDPPPPPPQTTQTPHQTVETNYPVEQSTHPNKQQYHSSPSLGDTHLSHAKELYSNDTPYSSDSFQQSIAKLDDNVVDKDDNSVNTPCSSTNQSIPLLDNVVVDDQHTSVTQSDLPLDHTVTQNNLIHSKINELHMEITNSEMSVTQSQNNVIHSKINELHTEIANSEMPVTQSHPEMNINLGYSQVNEPSSQTVKKSPGFDELPPIREDQPLPKDLDNDFSSPNKSYPSEVDLHSQHEIYDSSVQTENTKTKKDDSLITDQCLQPSQPTSQMYNSNVVSDVPQVRMSAPDSGIEGPSHHINAPPFHINPPWLQHDPSSQIKPPESLKSGPPLVNVPIPREDHQSNIDTSIKHSAVNSDSQFGNNMATMQNTPSNKDIIKRSTVDFPGKMCQFFPNCNMGNKCKFEHPICKANKNCIDCTCPFEHSYGLEITAVNDEGPAPKLKDCPKEPVFMFGQIVNSGNSLEKKEFPKQPVGDPINVQFDRTRKVMDDQINISGNCSQDNLQGQYNIQEKMAYPQISNFPVKDYPPKAHQFGNTSQINRPENMNVTMQGSFLRDHCSPPGIIPQPNFPRPNFPRPNFPRPNFPPPRFPLQDTVQGIPPRELQSQEGLQKDFPSHGVTLHDFPRKDFLPRNVPTHDRPLQEFTPPKNIPRPDFPFIFPPKHISQQDFSLPGVPNNFPPRHELRRDGPHMDHPRDIPRQFFSEILSREKTKHDDYQPPSSHSQDNDRIVSSGNMPSRVPPLYAKDEILRDNLRDCPPSSSHPNLPLSEGQPIDCASRDNLSRHAHSSRRDGPAMDHPRDFPQRDDPLLNHPSDFRQRDDPSMNHPKDFPQRDGPSMNRPRDFLQRDGPPMNHPRDFPQRDGPLKNHQRDFLQRDDPSINHTREFSQRDGPSMHHPKDFPHRDGHSMIHPNDFPQRDGPSLNNPKDFPQRDGPSMNHPKDFAQRDGPSLNNPKDFPQRDVPLRDVPPRDYPHRDLPRIGDLGKPNRIPSRDLSGSSQDDYPPNSPRRDNVPGGMPPLPFRGLSQKNLPFGDNSKDNHPRKNDSQDTSQKVPEDTIKTALLDSPSEDAEHERRKQQIIGIIGKAPEPPRMPEGYRKRDIPPIMDVDANARPLPAKYSRLTDTLGRDEEYERRKKEILGTGRNVHAVYDHRHGLSDIHRHETPTPGNFEKDNRFERRISGIRPTSPVNVAEPPRDALHRRSPPPDGRFRGQREAPFRNELDRNPPYADHHSRDSRDRRPYEPVRVTDELAAKDAYDYNRQLPGYRRTDGSDSMDRVPTLPRFSDINYPSRDGLDPSKKLTNDNIDISRRYRDLSARELSGKIKDQIDSDVEHSGNTKESINNDRRDQRGSPYRRNRHNEFDTPNRDFTSERPRRHEGREHERRNKDKIQGYEPSHHKDRVSEMSYQKEQDTKKGKEVAPIDTTCTPISELKPEIFSAADILDSPGRETRPKNIVIILRGIPGSGKSFMAKLIKDKESFYGAQPPRILALDDYFMQEVEKTEKKPGGKGNAAFVKKQEYVYEADMEAAYRGSLLKAFNKTLNDGFFPMVIVDAINDQASHFDQFWSDAKHKGFEVFISEISGDVKECMERSVHKRTEDDIKNMLKNWEKVPIYYKQLDVSSLLQDAAIDDVEMEEANEGVKTENVPDVKKEDEDEEDLPNTFHIPKSKWEDSKEETMAKLDGVSKRRTKDPNCKSPVYEDEDEDDPYDEKEADMRLGKKRVRWADLEEKKQIDHQKKIGFSIGMDWKIFTDPNAQIPK